MSRSTSSAESDPIDRTAITSERHETATSRTATSRTATSRISVERVRALLPGGTFTISAVVVAVIFASGAWQRRWIADDGLIVLRTVRNLLAGNGPVFNKGERVEANTSTVWTYLIWFWTWITDAQIEYVVLWIALVLSVAALPLAMWGTYRLLGLSNRPGAGGLGLTLVVPLGALVYIALPPARDFATSGLEVSLCIFWIAVLWCQFVAWGRHEVDAETSGVSGTGRRESAKLLALGFTAGLSPLIRPELAIVGALVLLLVFATRMSWRLRIAFVVVAATLPVAYQIFRMGYYGLLIPNTAVAKDASGSKFAQGFRYLGNLFGPYLLLLPMIVALLAAGLVWYLRSRSMPRRALPASAGRIARIRSRLQSPGAVVAVVLVGGLLEAIYWLRQGGDFMHARVLLVPLFLLMLPVMVLPITIPTSLRGAQGTGGISAGVVGVVGAVGSTVFFVTTVVWAIVTAHSPGMPNGTDIGRSGIVDERRFYIQNIGIEHPVTAEDYLNYPRMRAMVSSIAEHSDKGGVLLPSGNYDEWYYDPLPVPPPAGSPKQITVFFLNLGMTSMNSSLDVRVIDQMGLAYPIASHTERLEDARIGHDKDLDTEWVIAESGAVPVYPFLPLYLDQDWVKQSKEALTCQPTQDLIASYKAPMSLTRFRRNLVQSFDFTSYRIDRVPRYELQRCRLPIPAPIRSR